MTYVIAFVIIIVAAGALLLFREPVEAPVVPIEENTQTEEAATNNSPEGFTPPTTPPPSTEVEGQLEAEVDSSETEDMPEAAMEETATGATGTYEGEASYSTGRAVHELDVTLTIENDVVVAADVTYDGGDAPTPILQSFDQAYQAEVIGQNIDTIELSRVGGASWTSDAFNEAVSEVRAQL